MGGASSVYRVAHELFSTGQIREEANGEKAEQKIQAKRALYNMLQQKQKVKYKLHVYGFTAGLFFLMCARGLVPSLRVAEWVIQCVWQKHS